LWLFRWDAIKSSRLKPLLQAAWGMPCAWRTLRGLEPEALCFA
jgi:hypothetical protein